ncbi:hypothetical protein WA158_003624 [Blastocystis sp. Blastoise]
MNSKRKIISCFHGNFDSFASVFDLFLNITFEMEESLSAAMKVYGQGRRVYPEELHIVPLWKGDNNSVCQICNAGGELLLCSFCNLSFHCHCLSPPLSKIPDGYWACPECCIEFDQNRKKIERSRQQQEQKKKSERSTIKQESKTGLKPLSSRSTKTSVQPKFIDPYANNNNNNNNNNMNDNNKPKSNAINKLKQEPHIRSLKSITSSSTSSTTDANKSRKMKDIKETSSKETSIKEHKSIRPINSSSLNKLNTSESSSKTTSRSSGNTISSGLKPISRQPIVTTPSSTTINEEKPKVKTENGIPRPLPSQPVPRGGYKTEMCAFNKKGLCRYGATCHFAHSTQELRESEKKPSLFIDNRQSDVSYDSRPPERREPFPRDNRDYYEVDPRDYHGPPSNVSPYSRDYPESRYAPYPSYMRPRYDPPPYPDNMPPNPHNPSNYPRNPPAPGNNIPYEYDRTREPIPRNPRYPPYREQYPPVNAPAPYYPPRDPREMQPIRQYPPSGTISTIQEEPLSIPLDEPIPEPNFPPSHSPIISPSNSPFIEHELPQNTISSPSASPLAVNPIQSPLSSRPIPVRIPSPPLSPDLPLLPHIDIPIDIKPQENTILKDNDHKENIDNYKQMNIMETKDKNDNYNASNLTGNIMENNSINTNNNNMYNNNNIINDTNNIKTEPMTTSASLPVDNQSLDKNKEDILTKNTIKMEPNTVSTSTQVLSTSKNTVSNQPIKQEIVSNQPIKQEPIQKEQDINIRDEFLHCLQLLAGIKL